MSGTPADDEAERDRLRLLNLARVRRFRARRSVALSDIDAHPDVAAARAHWEATKHAFNNAERAMVAARREYLSVKRRAVSARLESETPA